MRKNQKNQPGAIGPQTKAKNKPERRLSSVGVRPIINLTTYIEYIITVEIAYITSRAIPIAPDDDVRQWPMKTESC